MMAAEERDRELTEREGERQETAEGDNSQDHISPFLQFSISIPLHLADFEQPALELQALRAAQHHLAVPLELQQVVEVPGGARVADLQRRVDLGPRDGQLRNQVSQGASRLDHAQVHVDRKV